MQRKAIHSWEEARAVAPEIIRALNSDSALLLAAAANPLIAFEELGYEIANSFQQEFVDRLRLGTHKAARLRHLREEIFLHAGGVFDLYSSQEIDRVLFQHLKLARPKRPSPIQAYAPPEFSAASERLQDPLEEMRGKHPMIDLLLEYRRLDAQTPRLASRELFMDIKEGKHRIPFKLRARLRRHTG